MPIYLKTLDDVQKAGQRMIAVCHQVDCRHSQIVDVARVIYHVGAAHQLVPVKGKVHFSERMRCPECDALGMFVWMDVPKDPEPSYTAKHPFKILDWGKGHRDVLERELAICTNLEVARAAFEVACAVYPENHITMQQGAFITEDSRVKVIAGGGQSRLGAGEAERQLWEPRVVK